MLNEEEILDSCEAVRQFLIDGEKFVNGGNIPCYFIEDSQRTETVIHVEFIYHIPSYNLDDDVFKSYGLRNPVWSGIIFLAIRFLRKDLRYFIVLPSAFILKPVLTKQ
jgi:hypothetical protein